jgi:hypothetical protein
MTAIREDAISCLISAHIASNQIRPSKSFILGLASKFYHVSFIGKLNLVRRVVQILSHYLLTAGVTNLFRSLRAYFPESGVRFPTINLRDVILERISF